MPKITLKLNEVSINVAIKEVRAYQKKIETAGAEIARRLGEIGYNVAYQVMSGHIFSGDTIGSLELIDKGNGRFILMVSSQAILFFEFGSGAKYGEGHPWDDDFGFGPGTYPGNGHWDDPEGWWFPTEDPRLIIRTDRNGQGWGHSYGNKPYMPFYKASKAMRGDILRIAREVLK